MRESKQMKLKMKGRKENKGITLIALVITIIVLLILAAVSIATLTGENGILNQASKAGDNTRNATEKEQVQLAYNTKMSKNMEKGKYTVDTDDIEGLQNELDNLDTGAEAKENGGKIEVVFPSGNKYTIENGKVSEPKKPVEEAKVGEKVTGENKEYTKDGKTAVIPVGFAIVPGCDNIDEGLVISDKEGDTESDSSHIVAEGNQFVWVPVSKENFEEEFVRHDYSKDNIAYANFVTDTAEDYKYYEPNPQTTDTTYTTKETLDEVKKIYESVEKNGGFYIGRYEAGTTATSGEGIRGEMVCKKGVTVYNYISWGNSMKEEKGGAVEVARGFAEGKGYTNVTSTLCYGVQWDAVMRWINEDKDLKQYLKDSTDKGNYSRSILSGGTGSNENYQMKNIYDMAGNVYEWTMEAYSTDNRVNRGGYYYSTASNAPVSRRNNNDPDSPGVNVGFRPALYL